MWSAWESNPERTQPSTVGRSWIQGEIRPTVNSYTCSVLPVREGKMHRAYENELKISWIAPTYVIALPPSLLAIHCFSMNRNVLKSHPQSHIWIQTHSLAHLYSDSYNITVHQAAERWTFKEEHTIHILNSPGNSADTSARTMTRPPVTKSLRLHKNCQIGSHLLSIESRILFLKVTSTRCFRGRCKKPPYWTLM